ncbi:MAG: heavy-metal-associated domain-containing protein [Ignavibacteria bacterium]|jgi:mercuric ion binding protein
MKTFITMMLGIVLIPLMAFAAEQKVTLKVSGNCGSCKKRIVKAANSIDGVSDASWDKTKKVFTATIDDAKTNVETVTKAILEAGYDVEDAKGNDEAYSKLPDCCRYRDVSHD